MGLFQDIGAFIGETKEIAAQFGAVGEEVKVSATESVTEVSATLASAATEITATVEQTGATLKEAVDISETPQ